MWRKLNAEELMPLSCGVGEDSWVSWTARRSIQSILKEIRPGCSLEGTMLKLKLQYFGHLMQRVDSLQKTLCWEGLGAGGEGNDRGWDGWIASLTRWTWVSVNSGSWWWTGRPSVLRFMGSQRVGHDWATELNWTELMHYIYNFSIIYIMQRLRRKSLGFSSMAFIILRCILCPLSIKRSKILFLLPIGLPRWH